MVCFLYNLLCKFYTVSKLKRTNNKSSHRMLLTLSGNINLNPEPVYNS